MDYDVGAGEDLVGLPEIAQVREAAKAMGATVGDKVNVQDVVAVLAQVTNDPSTRLAAAARDDDPHRPTVANHRTKSEGHAELELHGRLAGERPFSLYMTVFGM